MFKKKHLSDKRAEIQPRTNKRGVGGDRLHFRKEQVEDVRVVWHIHLNPGVWSAFLERYFSHPSQKDRRWDQSPRLSSSSLNKVDDAVEDHGEDLLPIMLFFAYYKQFLCY